jgi:hypothetical protein
MRREQNVKDVIKRVKKKKIRKIKMSVGTIMQ